MNASLITIETSTTLAKLLDPWLTASPWALIYTERFCFSVPHIVFGTMFTPTIAITGMRSLRDRDNLSMFLRNQSTVPRYRHLTVYSTAMVGHPQKARVEMKPTRDRRNP